MAAPTFATVKQLADESGFSRFEIYKLVRAGKLAYTRLTKCGPLKIARADWERCLRLHYQPATAALPMSTAPRRGRGADCSDLPGHDTFVN